jgi:C1A family cysteine protease
LIIDEERERLRIFLDHLKYVLKSNFEKLRTFQLELNEFADWSLDEFNAWKKGLVVSDSLRRNLVEEENDEESVRQLYQHHYHLRRLKRNLHRRRAKDRRFLLDWFQNLFHRGGNDNQTINIFDWRTKSVISSVKNQLKCGCCYAFATATIMETLYAMKTNSQTIIDFSPQQIADCSSNGNTGCSGGSFPPSVRYLSGQGGKIATDASYPYVGKKQTCRTDNLNQITLGNIEYGSIPEGDEVKLAEALTNHGPIFIGLDADSRLFMFYKSGVLKIKNCPTARQDMDHAMVIVGYGYDNNVQTPYWIIKNSWGTKWGEHGYLRLAKDSGNMCGVASMAYYGKLT